MTPRDGSGNGSGYGDGDGYGNGNGNGNGNGDGSGSGSGSCDGPLTYLASGLDLRSLAEWVLTTQGAGP